jgi:diadenosine tetraphosphate (Ap4A) HIT family hydrolase
MSNSFEPDPTSDEADEYCLYCTIGSGVLPAKGGVRAIGPRWTLNAGLQRTGRPHYILQTRRHIADFDGLEPEEAAELGPIIAALVGEMKSRFGADRVAVSYLSENRPAHVHLRFIPRFASDATSARGLGLFGAAAPVDYAGPNDVEAITAIAASLCARFGYEPATANDQPDSPTLD